MQLLDEQNKHLYKQKIFLTQKYHLQICITGLLFVFNVTIYRIVPIG